MRKRTRRKTKKAEVQTVRRAITDRLLDTLPVLAPLPTAWAIGAAMNERLGWPLPVIAIATAAIETSGFVSADTASKYYEFNRTAKNGETKSPAWLAYSTFVLYLGVTLAMTFLYEPMAAIFPGLSAVGFFLFVLRKDQQAREAGRIADRATAKAEDERVKAERKAKREQNKLAKAKAEPAMSQPQPALAEVKPAFVCSCGKAFATQPALNAHQRKHKQIVGYTVSMEPITQAEVK